MNHLLLILGMVVVTYLPRMIPIALLSDLELPEYLRRFLSMLPAAALGALIIPGVADAIPDHSWIGIASVGVAAAVSVGKGGMMLSVLVAVAVAFGLLLVV